MGEIWGRNGRETAVAEWRWGQTPNTITVCAYDDLVDHGKPGDRAVITGVYRAVPMRVNPRMRSVKTVFRTCTPPSPPLSTAMRAPIPTDTMHTL